MTDDTTRGRDDRAPEDANRVDLAPLDPRADAARFERLLREVRRAATPELLRRQANLTVWDLIARWQRPILAGSGLLTLISAVVLALSHPATMKQATLAEMCGVPSPVARWVQATGKPTPADLLSVEWSNQ
jgi:hypothetical protein